MKGNFKKKYLNKEDKELIKTSAQFLVEDEWESIKKMIDDLEPTIKELPELKLNKTKQIIIGVSAISKRLHKFTKTLKDFRYLIADRK